MPRYFEMREVEGRGMAAFATENLFPGQLIFTESEPLLITDAETLEYFQKVFPAAPVFAQIFAMWFAFEKQSEENKAKILKLFGTRYGQIDQLIAEAFKSLFYNICLKHKFDAASHEEMFANFKRVISIVKCHTVALGANSVRCAAYETVSRFAHSCLPNASMDHDLNDEER